MPNWRPTPPRISTPTGHGRTISRGCRQDAEPRQAELALACGRAYEALGASTASLQARRVCGIQGQIIFPPIPFHSGLFLPNLTAWQFFGIRWQPFGPQVVTPP